MKKHIIILIIISCVNLITGKSLSTTNSKDIVIYWDASLSQQEKNVDKEFEFLDAYFKSFPNLNVKLVIFNTKIVSDEKLEVKSSNWSLIKQKLKEVVYDGASDFSLVNTELIAEQLLFFTDGNDNLGNFKASLYSPRIITISSKLNINKKFLHETAFYNRGYYVNLLESDIASSIKAIIGETIMPKLVFVTEKKESTNKKYIQGVVTDKNNNLVPNVNIYISDKKRGTITDQDGAYKIAAELGDFLVFSFVNMKETVIEVSEENIIDIKLSTDVNELGPAIVRSKKSIEPEKVKVGNFEVNKRALGYTVQSIDSKDIGDARGDVGKAIVGKFSGVSLGNTDNSGLTIVRGLNSILGNNFALFIVDGIPLPRSFEGGRQIADYDFINPDNIENVTVLKGYAATNQYGAEGRNGVILITTKVNTHKFSSKEETEDPIGIEYKPYESSLAISTEHDSKFILQLKKFTDHKRSYEEYLNMLSSNKDNVTFFVECSDYFFKTNHPETGSRILSNLIELFPKDVSILKVLAFNLEKHNMLDQAESIYKKITTISPNMSQGYLDLANHYCAAKKFKESVTLFKNITTNKIKKVESFEGLNDQISNDFRSLLSNRNQKWNVTNIDQNYFRRPKYNLRAVVEWSHPQTEFKIQFINSKKEYFEITHTQLENKRKIEKELEEGFTSEEYISSDLSAGKWFISIVPPENYKSDLKYPKFLKVTLYTNFGHQDQKLENHIVNLDQIDDNKIIAAIALQ